AVNTHGPQLLDPHGQMPQYRSRVKAVITPKFAASFDKSVPVAEQSVKTYGLDRTCAVYATGVEVVDSDSAQVLVAGSISQTVLNHAGKRGSAGEPAPLRPPGGLGPISREAVHRVHPTGTRSAGG